MARDWRTYEWWVGMRALCKPCGHQWIIRRGEPVGEIRSDGGISHVELVCPECERTITMSHPE